MWSPGLWPLSASLSSPCTPAPMQYHGVKDQKGIPGLFERERDGETDQVRQQWGGMGRRDRERGQGQKGRERKRRVGLRHRWIADWLIGEIFGRCRPLTPRPFSPLRSGSALHVREQGSTSCYLCRPGGLQEGEGLSGSASPILPMYICPQALVSKPCTARNR